MPEPLAPPNLVEYIKDCRDEIEDSSEDEMEELERYKRLVDVIIEELEV